MKDQHDAGDDYVTIANSKSNELDILDYATDLLSTPRLDPEPKPRNSLALNPVNTSL